MLALCFALFAAVMPLPDDAPVTDAAIRAWGNVPAVKAEPFPADAIGVATFSSRLLESKVSNETMAPLVGNFFKRNDARGALPDRPVVSLPGYDPSRTHALIVASPDARVIRIALLEHAKGGWHVAYLGEMNAMRPVPPMPSSGLKPFRVGGEVKAPRILNRVEPVYTAEAAKARIAGIVIVEAIIDRTGRVRDVQVLKPLPFGLDEAAVDAVKQWRFEPATLYGRPVDVIFNLTINFHQ